MCDNQFACWLQNRQKLKNISDDGLEFMANDLIEYFGGIRSIINKLFKHHTNLTINEHQKFFKLIHNKNKKYIQSLQAINDENELENEEKLDESKGGMIKLCDVNDECLCNLFTFLSLSEHRNLQKCCIHLNIIGTMRGSFISSQQMFKFGYIPHLITNIKRLTHSNKNNPNNESQKQIFHQFINGSIYTNNNSLNQRALKQLCFSGYFPSIIQSAMNNIGAVTEFIYSISFNDKLCWLLVNDDTFNVLKNMLDSNMFEPEFLNQARAEICVVQSLQNLIVSHPSSIHRLYKKGIPDILMKHIPKYSNEGDWHFLYQSLILLSFFIPFIREKLQIQGIMKVIIDVSKILMVWIYDKKLLSSTVWHKIPAVIGRILYLIHCNPLKIDCDPLILYASISQLISQLISSIMKLDCFHCLDTEYYDDTLYELVLNLFKCKWGHIDIVEEYFKNIGSMHNKTKRVRIQSIIEVVLESKIDEETKKKRLLKLYQVFERDIYLAFHQNVKIAIAYMPIIIDPNQIRLILKEVSSIKYHQISAFSEILFSAEIMDCLKKIFEATKEEINRDDWMDRNYIEYAPIISIISMIYTNCRDDVVREQCQDLLLQIWSQDLFTYFRNNGINIDNEDLIAFKNMITASIEISKVVRKRFVVDNPWFIHRLLVLRTAQQIDDMEMTDNKHEFVRYLDDIWRSVEALDETQNKIESKNYLINNHIIEQYTICLIHFKLSNVDDEYIENLLRSLTYFLESYALKKEDNAHFIITLKRILIILLNDYHHNGLKEAVRNLLCCIKEQQHFK